MGHAVTSRVLAIFMFCYVKMHEYVPKLTYMYFTDERAFSGVGREEKVREGENDRNDWV